MIDEVTGEEKAIQAQEAADCIGKALATHSSGAVFFGLALYLASYLYHKVKKEDQDEQLDAFANVARALLNHANTNGQNMN